MLGRVEVWPPLVSTFDSPKVAKARLPFPACLQVLDVVTIFLLLVVTFLMIGR